MRIVALATGLGNIRSVVRALERAAATVGESEIVTTADPDLVRRADVLVVPGQGAFGSFAAALDGGLREALLERVRAGVPYLGICLGLQILFEESEEAPSTQGLALVRGKVRRLSPGVDAALGRERPLPHMGWNRAEPVREGGTPIVTDAHYYFAHSFASFPDDPDVVLATTTYGDATFASAVRSDNIVGIQFHPEKSQHAGLAVLERFFSTLKPAGAR